MDKRLARKIGGELRDVFDFKDEPFPVRLLHLLDDPNPPHSPAGAKRPAPSVELVEAVGRTCLHTPRRGTGRR